MGQVHWKAALSRVVWEAKRKVRASGEFDLQDKNVAFFLNTPWREWMLTSGEVTVTTPQLPDGKMWSEPLHNDGGMSVLHMGITLWGRRDLRCLRSAEGSVDRTYVCTYVPLHDICTYSSGHAHVAAFDAALLRADVPDIGRYERTHIGGCMNVAVYI